MADSNGDPPPSSPSVIVKHEIYHRDKSREFIIVSVFKFFITILVAVKSHKAVLYGALYPPPLRGVGGKVDSRAAWEGWNSRKRLQPLGF